MYGKQVWMIPDGYMSDTKKGDLVSHEAICVLNLSGEEAHVKLTVYFEALAVWSVRLHAFNAESMSSIPAGEIRSHKPHNEAK